MRASFLDGLRYERSLNDNSSCLLSGKKLVLLCVLLCLFGRKGLAQYVTSTVNVGNSPIAADVNPITNKVYIASNGTSPGVTIIDGLTNSTSSISSTSGNVPTALAINTKTNKIYVAEAGSSNDVLVIDGGSNSTATVTTGTNPFALAVNPVTNKIYVANHDSNTVTVIDGSNNSTATVTVGSNPDCVAVNPA